MEILTVLTCIEWMFAGWVIFIPIFVICRASLGGF